MTTESAAQSTSDTLPKMAAALLDANSPQGDLMRFGKLPEVIPEGGLPPSETVQSITLSTAIYDGLAVLYNDAAPGTMLIVSLPNRPTMGNLKRILTGRGLVLGEDYLAYRAKFDVNGLRYAVKARPLVLERMTDTLMKVSTGRQNFGKEMAAAARERGEFTPSLTHAPEPPADPRKLKGRGRLKTAEAADASSFSDLLGRTEPNPGVLGSGSLVDMAESASLKGMPLLPPATNRLGS